MSFIFVKAEVFKRIVIVVQSKWVGISSHVTIAKNSYTVYLRENNRLSSGLQEQQISFTIDTCTFM